MGNNLNCSSTSDGETTISLETKDGKQNLEILLLGAGDGGKSTIFKQLRILYDHAFTIKERQEYAPTIIENVIHTFCILAKASVEFKIPMSTSDNIERCQTIAHLPKEVLLHTDKKGWSCLDDHGCSPEDFLHLWADDAMKLVYNRRNEFQLDDNAPYYLNKLAKLVEANYVPTLEDVLRSRTKSVGVVKQSFTSSASDFQVIDVGGQRSERKKWFNVFTDQIDAIVYVSSLSEFDQTMWEDDASARLPDSVRVFNLCYRKLPNIDIYLVLNKQDVMKAKIEEGRMLSNFCPDFTGDNSDCKQVQDYICNQFTSNDHDNRIKGIHYLTAVDATCVKHNVESILNSIIQSKYDKEHPTLTSTSDISQRLSTNSYGSFDRASSSSLL